MAWRIRMDSALLITDDVIAERKSAATILFSTNKRSGRHNTQWENVYLHEYVSV